MKSIFLRSAGLITSILILWYLDVWSEFGTVVQEIAPFTPFIAISLAMASTWMTSARWRLLDPDIGQQMRHWDYFRYVMIGATANMFMPGALGGDAIRIAFVAKDLQSHRSAAFIAIVADRWLGLFSIIVLGTVACVFAGNLEHRLELLSILIAMDCMILIGWFVTSNPALSKRVASLIDRPGPIWRASTSIIEAWRMSNEFYKANPTRVLRALILCLPIHGCWFVIVYVLAREIGIELSFSSLAMTTALSWVIVAVPISFGGVGIRELSFVYLLSLQGIDAERAVVLGACQSAIFLARALIGMPLFWLGRKSMAEIGGEGR